MKVVSEDAHETDRIEWRVGGPSRLSGFLRPGAWRVALKRYRQDMEPAPVFAHRADVSIPTSFASDVLGEGALSGEDKSITWIGAVVPHPSSQSPSAPNFAADIWFRRHSEKWLLCDLERDEFLRWMSSPLPSPYVEMRRSYSQYVRAPGFQLSDDRLRVTESVAQGVVLDQIPETLRIPLIRRILVDYAALIHAEAEIPPIETLAKLDAALRRSPLAEARERRLEVLRIHGSTAEIPFTVSNGDLTPTNVLADGDSYSVIDFDHLRARPFWQDPFDLVRTAAPKAFREGLFEREWGTIFSAAGFAASEEMAHWGRLAQLGRESLKALKHGKPATGIVGPRGNRRAAAGQALQRWSRIESDLPVMRSAPVVRWPFPEV